ncbi:MAG: hypothetical protein KAX49_15675 [Halanaerobiales bacterium]|nr:hypothetical protein [Halanaerobiales bacterium]
MNTILNKFDMYTSRQISNYSHKENLWKSTCLKDIINLDRAKELNEI